MSSIVINKKNLSAFLQYSYISEKKAKIWILARKFWFNPKSCMRMTPHNQHQLIHIINGKWFLQKKLAIN